MDVLPGPDEPPAEAAPRIVRRRFFWTAATFAAIAVLGAGALAAHQLTHRGTTALHEPGTGALPPAPGSPWPRPTGMPSAGSPSTSASASASASTSGSASASATGSASASASAPGRPSAPTVRTIAPHVVPAPVSQWPFPAATGRAIPPAAVQVTNSGSLPRDHHTLRVVSARGDLTGQRELAWVADAGHPVGDALCSQNFRFNPGSSAGPRPTMLICWHTSADRSVYTVAVDIDHPPSERASVATIDRVWSTLG